MEPQIVAYLSSPPDAARLGQILDMLGLAPRGLMRKQEALYKDLGLDDPTLDRAILIHATVANPILIERPIVVNGVKATLGRPPEAVLDIV